MAEAKIEESEKFVIPEKPDKEQKLGNCKNCGRHFLVDRLETHELICQKQKQRNPFDVCLQRVRGTECEKFYNKNKNRKAEKPFNSNPQNSWRKQHEEFLMSMKAAREVMAHLKKGGNLKDLPPPPPLDYSDYIQCPHCLRKFNETAAQRHIPKCANLQCNKPKAPPITNSMKTVNAKQTMSAATRK